MEWIKYTDRKPPKVGKYFWKGKDSWGGYTWYYENGGFEFDPDIPSNKIDVNVLYWLDETLNPNHYEKTNIYQVRV